MADPVQQALNGAEIAAILGAISPDRFKPYLHAAGYDEERALDLYLWNARLGEAFHMPIQAVEVALRNSINIALSAGYTPNWWECKNLFNLLDEDRKADLFTVFRRIRNRDLELYRQPEFPGDGGGAGHSGGGGGRLRCGGARQIKKAATLSGSGPALAARYQRTRVGHL
jgi:hypothetical protein